MKPKLILVEGVAGSGKSTTSQWLNLTLGRSFPTAWYPEDGEPGGLRCYYDAERQTATEYGQTLVSRWADFLAESFLEEGTWIAESALLQSPIHGLLLRDVDATTIEGVVGRLFQVLSSIEPCLIYLRPSDPGEAIRRACGSRYEGLLEEYIRRIESSPFGIRHGLSGFEGLAEFWSKLARICDELVDHFEGKKVVVRMSGDDRESSRSAILNFLSDNGFALPSISDFVPPITDLSRYAGTYTRKIGDRTAKVEVRIVDGELTIFGLAPYLWDAGERLIAKAPGIFAAASWPTDVHFQERDDGVTSFHLATILGGRKTDEVFPRATIANI